MAAVYLNGKIKYTNPIIQIKRIQHIRTNHKYKLKENGRKKVKYSSNPYTKNKNKEIMKKLRTNQEYNVKDFFLNTKVLAKLRTNHEYKLKGHENKNKANAKLRTNFS